MPVQDVSEPLPPPGVELSSDPVFLPEGSVPRPATPLFDELLKRYRQTGLPMVGIGSWGPSTPQIRAPSPDAPSTDQLDREMKQIATSQWGWVSIHQPVDGFAGALTAQTREELRRRRRLRDQQLSDWDPGRYFAACMWASHACHVQLQSDGDVAAALELRADDERGWEDEEPAARRSLSETIERGDVIWAALGAWPWSAFPHGHPPHRWWEDQRALDSLLAGIAAQAEELAVRLRRACYLIEDLGARVS